MADESRRKFLMRYAAMVVAAATAPNGARAAEGEGNASRDLANNVGPGYVLYGPPPSPDPTLHPWRPRPPAPVYGPPPSPYPTVDPTRPPPPAPVYGPPPRDPLDK